MANIIMIKHGADAPPIEKLNDFELGYSINEQKLYIKEVKNGTATLRSFSSDGKMNEALTQISGKLDASALPTAINTALAQAKTSGEFDGTSVTVKSVSESTADGGSNVVTFSDGKTLTVKNGSKGSPGTPGKTPVRGTDYWTAADIAEIKSYVDEAILGGAW